MAGPRVVAIGGGAAGFFAALRSAERGCAVTLLEAGSEPLAKVRVSGGGRCNLTQARLDVERLAESYPRGAKELRGVFARFGPADAMRWFEDRGVRLKVEEDGRVFPVTDDSGTIVDCLLRAAGERGVVLRTRTRPERLTPASADGWRVHLRGGDILEADRVLLATGSGPAGLALAAAAGHEIVPPVPALFSLVVRDPRIEGLAGVAVPSARATLEVAGLKRPVVKDGPLLVTHQGLSAHAILRVSSVAARELAEAGYAASLTVDFAPDAGEEALAAAAAAIRARHPKGTVGAHGFVEAIPRRLWERLVAAAGLDPATRWAEAPKKGIVALLGEIKRARFEATGKGDFRDEIVTAGGVSRKEVDWTRMESRLAPGLHFAGEVLDVDGLTGGYNFQSAWSTAWIAGTAMAADRPSKPRRDAGDAPRLENP